MYFPILELSYNSQQLETLLSLTLSRGPYNDAGTSYRFFSFFLPRDKLKKGFLIEFSNRNVFHPLFILLSFFFFFLYFTKLGGGKNVYRRTVGVESGIVNGLRVYGTKMDKWPEVFEPRIRGLVIRKGKKKFIWR